MEPILKIILKEDFKYSVFIKNVEFQGPKYIQKDTEIESFIAGLETKNSSLFQVLNSFIKIGKLGVTVKSYLFTFFIDAIIQKKQNELFSFQLYFSQFKLFQINPTLYLNIIIY